MNQEINNEIENLKKLKDRWSRRINDKGQASNLTREVRIFIHTIGQDYPNTEKSFKRNKSAEIAITDGLEDLEKYINSILKQKDNHYSVDGVRNICRGLTHLILSLERDL